MFKPQHCGLYFTNDHIGQARREQDSEPFRSAFLFLRDREQQGAEAAQWNAFRYRFQGDEDAGEKAVDMLIYDPMPGGSGLLDQIRFKWTEVAVSALAFVRSCPAECATACIDC
ncbi:MAG: DUF1998 domain-containing protein, partial [Chloroflexota bacterium]